MKLNRNDYAIEATTDGGYYAYLIIFLTFFKIYT